MTKKENDGQYLPPYTDQDAVRWGFGLPSSILGPLADWIHQHKVQVPEQETTEIETA